MLMQEEQAAEGDSGADRSAMLVGFETNRLADTVGGVPIWRKPVQAIHCYAKGSEMTGLTRRLFNALCIHVQEAYKELDKAQRELIWSHNASPIFELTHRRLRSIVEYESKDYERLLEALQRLHQTSFVYNVMGDAGRGRVETIGTGSTYFIHTLVIGEGPHRGRIQFQMSPAALRMVLDPYPYASINMEIANALGYGAAIALYENCVRYLNTRNRLTAALPVETWTNLIAGEGLYIGNYKDFKRSVLLKAMARLEALDAVPFSPELLETKGARNKVTELQFKLHPKKGQELIDATAHGWSAAVVDELKSSWAMDDDDISALARMASFGEVQHALVQGRLMLKRKADRCEPIASPPDYFRGILTNLRAGRSALEAQPQEAKGNQVGVDERMDLVMKRTEFDGQRSQLAAKRLKELPQPLLAQLQCDFADVRKDSPSIQSMLQRGWDSERTGLWPLFANWVLTEREDVAPLLLYRAAETNFEAWLAERSAAS